MKYARIDIGQVEAVFNKLGGEERITKFLRGELIATEPERSWYEKDGVIYFSVISDGTTGEEWIKRLDLERRFQSHVSDYARSILLSPEFKPTSGITTEIAVLKGELFSDDKRNTKNIRAEVLNRKLAKPNAEVACLIREKFMDEEIEAMGLCWIVAMHEPIKDSSGDPRLLYASRINGGRWLDAFWSDYGYEWHRVHGFAFEVSKKSSES